MTTHIVHQKNISYNVISIDSLIFGIQGIGWDLSMTRISYKLTKRTTKTEKFEKILEMYNIIIYKTIGYKLTASGNITNLTVNYKFMKPIRILRLPKNKKKGKNSKLKQFTREKFQRH